MPIQMTDPSLHFAFHGTALNPDTGTIANYRELRRCSVGNLWDEANMEEIGQLFQGLGPNSKMPTGTNTLFFIHCHKVPRNKKSTYIRVICADRPKKTQTRRVRWTMGGDRIVYIGDVSTKTADIATSKMLFNSVISTPCGRFMTGDLKDFYLGTDKTEYEYTRIPVHLLPDSIITYYNLTDKIVDSYVGIHRMSQGYVWLAPSRQTCQRQP
jgi:hypothetical protein